MTVIRPELSQKNKYYVDRHRYYELKHFCLQYPLWKKAYEEIDEIAVPVSAICHFPSSNIHSDVTAKYGMMKDFYSRRMQLVEDAARKADPVLASYILAGVTEGLSYDTIKSRLDIPGGRDMYYDRYRKFFWLLDKARD